MAPLGTVASVGGQADVAGLHAFGIDQFAFRGLDVAPVCANSESAAIVAVVVENGAHVADEVGIVGYLDDDALVRPGLLR